MVQNWEHQRHLTVYRAVINKFYVKEKPLKAKNPKPSNHKEYLQFLQPGFKQTCIVKVIIIGGKLCLKCSCCGMSSVDTLATACSRCSMTFQVIKTLPFNGISHTLSCILQPGDKELDKWFNVLVENQKPGPSLPCSSISDFRKDLAIGESTSNHDKEYDKEYFELTLPTCHPKVHPGCIWSTVGPYANNPTSQKAIAAKPAAKMTIVSLSQAAQDHNDQYSEFLEGITSTDNRDNAISMDNDEAVASLNDDWGDDSGGEDEANQSMVTHATQSPDQPSCKDQRLQDMRATLKNTSLMSLAKPLFELTINRIGGNAKMSLDFLDELYQLKSHYMSERH